MDHQLHHPKEDRTPAALVDLSPADTCIVRHRGPIKQAVIEAVDGYDEIDRHPFADHIIKVQDGKVVHIETHIKHKPVDRPDPRRRLEFK